MTKRSPAVVVVLGLLTLFIYPLYWAVKTTGEINRTYGTSVPTGWLYIVPFVQWWWMWKFGTGVEAATRGKLSQVITFILLFLIGPIGMAIVQAKLNETIDQGGNLPQARAA